MGQPSWSTTPTSVTVPDRAGSVWTLALDWLQPGKLYRIQVTLKDKNEQQWTPAGTQAGCTADGDNTGLSRRDALILADARLGALIAKIGGSTADLVINGETTPVFAVGRCCVFKAPDEAKDGPLFLAMNDTPVMAGSGTGSLTVTISEAL